MAGWGDQSFAACADGLHSVLSPGQSRSVPASGHHCHRVREHSAKQEDTAGSLLDLGTKPQGNPGQPFVGRTSFETASCHHPTAFQCRASTSVCSSRGKTRQSTISINVWLVFPTLAFTFLLCSQPVKILCLHVPAVSFCQQ